MLHTGASCGPVASRCNGSLNAECAVRPRVRSVAAIPDEAGARAMSTFFQNVARSRFIGNVLPVPPHGFKKNSSSLCQATSFAMVSFANF